MACLLQFSAHFTIQEVNSPMTTTHLDPFFTLLDNLSTAVFLLDAELQVLYMNASASSLLATSTAHLADFSMSLFFAEDLESIATLKKALSEGRVYTKREAHLQGKESGALLVDFTVTPLSVTLPDAAALQTSALLLEIQPLDRFLKISREESNLSTQQAARALVKGVAHEIKNPLGGIRGAAQLLSKQLIGSELEDYTSVIINEVDRLRVLVDRMLGPKGLPKVTQVNIHEVLEHVRNIVDVESEQQLKFIRDYDVSLPEILIDRDQLIQALLNIVRNAMQALLENNNSEPPTIRIKTRILFQTNVGSRRHRKIISIAITDNGPGIPEAIASTLFYPMVSGRASGTGLGLSIAQSIIHQYQGVVECNSRPGLTTFTLLLPLEFAHEFTQ